jgi:hypothetical protein
MIGEVQVFLAAGMDGFFTDDPDLASAAAAPFRRATGGRVGRTFAQR